MPRKTGVDKLVVVVTVECDVVAMNKRMMPAGVDDDALVVIVDVERDEVALIQSSFETMWLGSRRSALPS